MLKRLAAKGKGEVKERVVSGAKVVRRLYRSPEPKKEKKPSVTQARSATFRTAADPELQFRGRPCEPTGGDAQFSDKHDLADPTRREK